MPLPDPLGVVGAPFETLSALRTALDGHDLSNATLILVTDSQGQRPTARYGVLIRAGTHSVLTVDAFGPRYGDAGREALRDLAAWARAHGVTNVRETVVNTYDFNRVLREPEDAELARLVAASNPSDLTIYLT